VLSYTIKIAIPHYIIADKENELKPYFTGRSYAYTSLKTA
jgi:hypothetical protein